MKKFIIWIKKLSWSSIRFLFKKFWSFLLLWNEIISIPLGLLLWHYSPWIMRVTGFDEGAGQYDSAVLQKIIFAIVAMAILSGFAWIFLKLAFPNVYKHLDEVLGESLNDSTKIQNLSKWEKAKISLWLLSLYLLGLVWLVNA